MTAASEGRVGRRLRRILLLLPYAINHPGVTIAELAERFGVDKRQLIDDLNLAFVCGLPGYGPGDLIEVAIENDCVFVDMAEYFASPLRLTPAEAVALYAGGAALAALPGMEEADALRRALDKLGRTLGASAEGDGLGAIEVEVEAGPIRHLTTLTRALQDRRRVSIQYLSASRGELTEREVDPWGLIAALGRSYLVGHDHRSGEERMFRIDRIKRVDVSDVAAEVPADFDPGRYRGAFVERERQDVVRLELSPEASRWFADYYPVRASTDLDDGWWAFEIVSGGTRWAATLVLRLGVDVRAVEPPAVLEEARRLARRVAARYSS